MADTKSVNIYEKLMNIQAELKAPKNQKNKFGNYYYRSAEDVLEAVKPLLAKYKAMLIMSDGIVAIGEHDPLLFKEEVYDNKAKKMKEETRVTGSQRYYVKATATLIDTEADMRISTTAYAREEENKKGQDHSQTTGSASSYARKYALNGLFAIDDTKDSDATSTGDKSNEGRRATDEPPKILSDNQIKRLYAIGYSAGIDAETVNGQVKTKFKKDVKDLTKEEYDKVCEGYDKLKK